MPNRILKESVKRSEQIDKLSWFEEVVFYRLILTADDYGCLDGRSVLLKNELFPTKDNVTKKAVEDAVSKLASVGLLCKYTVNGKPYLFFPTWAKHQRLRNRYRKYPEPPQEALQAFDRLMSVKWQPNVSQETADCPPELELEEELEGEVEERKINKKKAEEASPRKKGEFVPPTLEEVTEYCKSRQSIVDPKAFFDYFNEGKWIDSRGNPVLNWKQKIITWENKNISKAPEGVRNSGLSGASPSGDQRTNRLPHIEGRKLD